MDTSASCPNGFAYSSDRQITINYANAGINSLAFTAATVEVANTIDHVGGQTFDFTLPYALSNAAYSMNVRNGVNDVGISDLSLLGAGVLGLSQAVLDNGTCLIDEADTYIEDNAVSWAWGIPATYSDDYFNADMEVSSGGANLYYARGVLMHELLHGFALNHSDTSYSYLNYNILPWANRGNQRDLVDPLPDDREALRNFYGSVNSETDVGVMVTWYDNTSVSNGAANAKLLCRPSTGVAYSPDRFDPTCGVDAAGNDGSTDVCPGDPLFVRYALVNYGTTAVTVDEELWFSTDATLNRTGGVDIASATTVVPHVAAAQSSYRWGRVYTVPTGVAYNTYYYPILWVDSGGTAERSEQNNWIPLRDTIYVKPLASCP